MNNFIRFIVRPTCTGFLFFLLISPSESALVDSSSPNAVGNNPGASAVTSPIPGNNLVSLPSLNSAPSYTSYTYYGDRYRDPFIPLIGEMHTDTSFDRPPQISSLSLKGIVQDTDGRMALITGGVGSYILKDGRLYDGRNRMVKGISGVIKLDSVVLIGSDHTVRELRAKPVL